MRKITGTYPKAFSDVQFSIEVPGSWEELGPKQFAKIVQVLGYTKADKNTVAISLLALIFGPKGWHILQGLPDDLRHELIPLTNFLFEQDLPVKNFFPEIKIRKKRCAAPADDLSNLSFGEWCFIYQFFQYYHIDQNVSWLNKLIAVLYRPADLEQDPDSATFKGDIREVFNENLIEKRAKDVAAIDIDTKKAILAWFKVAVESVMQRRPHVFPAADQDESSTAESSEPSKDGRTWLTVFRELLGPKWGTAEQLKHTNALFILDALEEQQIAFKEASETPGS